MKNVDEVAAIDLGRPSSTQSQISLDEPDAPYVAAGRALDLKKRQSLASRPIHQPLTKFVRAVYNYCSDPEVKYDSNAPEDIVANPLVYARNELGNNILTYTTNYDTLKKDDAALNTYIYSDVVFENVFKGEGSFAKKRLATGN
jgi:hypothetical protein